MTILQFFQGIYTFFIVQPDVALARLLLIGIGLLLIYLGYRNTLDPLLMIPMGFGMAAVNSGLLVLESGNLGSLFLNPMASNVDELMYFLQVDFLQPVFTFLFSNGLLVCLIFMGIGTITEIDYLIAMPSMSFFLAVFAELGTIVTLPIAMAWGLSPKEAAAVSIVGGADGPMILFGSIMMAKDLLVPIGIVGYLYLSVCSGGFPLLAKLIPKELRGIEMDWRQVPRVSTKGKFAFAVIICVVLSLLFPVAAPLFVSFFVGLALKEAGVTKYVEVLSGPILYGSTFLLSFTLGALLSVDTILNPIVLKLLVLGVLALTLSGLGGLIGGLIYRKISKRPFNPLIGLAAVSCVPVTAKVAQVCAFRANRKCMILPFAMGPNVAGVITTAIITGIYVSGISFIR